MSMFRSVADISSSDPESSSDDGEYAHEVGSEENSIDPVPRSGGTRAASSALNAGLGDEELEPEKTSPAMAHGAEEPPELDADGHATLMTSALLEFFCMTRAVEILNSQPGSHNRFTRESPEVKFLGRKLYSYKSQFLSMQGVMADGIDGEDWQATRQYYRESLDMLGTTALEEMNAENPQPMIGSRSKGALKGPESSETSSKSKQLVSTSHRSRQGAPKSFDLGAALRRGNSVPGLLGRGSNISNIFVPASPMVAELPSLLPTMRFPSAVSMDRSSRYAMEFAEIKLLGRGSFGQVYQVVNHVDGQSYAVKKIPLSRRKLEILQEGGLHHLEHIMKEIRTLARLDHSNVVRYYGAWVEQPRSNEQGTLAQGSQAQDGVSVQSQRFSYEPSMRESSDDGNHDDKSFGVVFEYSEGVSVDDNSRSTLPGDHETSLAGMSTIKRQSSHQTNSSTRSKKSNQSIEDDDEDIESIPRNFSLPSPGLTSTFGDTDSDIFTDGFGEGPGHLQLQRRSGNDNEPPAIVLHIQMSLHPLTLSNYLHSHKRDILPTSPSTNHHHCFHLMPSLRLILGILSGVEYLHSQGIVHRDLKPANIFLSAIDTDQWKCARCVSEKGLHQKACLPRIGDFGLVADISHCADSSENDSSKRWTSSQRKKHVGTEFYCPRVREPSRQAQGKHRDPKEEPYHYMNDQNDYVDEKLDVYALGVILFELLYKLNTKMERQLVLFDLTRALSPDGISLPEDFQRKIDCANLRLEDGSTVGESITTCLKGMLEPDSCKRWSCQNVRQCLEKLLYTGMTIL